MSVPPRLEDYPDYRTQGESLSELKENLNDIYCELTSGNIPGVRKVGELRIAERRLGLAFLKLCR